MGNCCGEKKSLQNNTINLGKSDSKYDEVMKYCLQLKNLQHANVKPLSTYNYHYDNLVMNTFISQDQESRYFKNTSNIYNLDLQRYLENKKNDVLPSQIAKYIIRQICNGLKYLHDQNIIHGELNLRNIEINPNNNEIQICKLIIQYFHNQDNFKLMKYSFLS